MHHKLNASYLPLFHQAQPLRPFVSTNTILISENCTLYPLATLQKPRNPLNSHESPPRSFGIETAQNGTPHIPSSTRTSHLVHAKEFNNKNINRLHAQTLRNGKK